MFPASDFPIIAPLVARHVEDGAFYWSQLDGAADSPSVDFIRLALFYKALETHLDGLRIAGSAGRSPAVEALQRWQKAGETCICTMLWLQEADADLQNSLETLIRRRPEQVLRGAISALAWNNSDRAQAAIKLWSEASAEPCFQVAALRAAACRAAAASGIAILDALRGALLDTDLAVRAEAAIALGKLEPTVEAVSELTRCVAAQSALHAGLTGWYRKQAARRLNRWVRQLAWLLPMGAEEVAPTLTALPPREGLTFMLCHGDLSHLPLIVEHMSDDHVVRYAGWVWQTLTGIDLAATGFTLPEADSATRDPDTFITEAGIASDSGLVNPDVDAIRACMAADPHFARLGERSLLGRGRRPQQALALLEHAPQAVRSLAAQVLNQRQSDVCINVRSPATQQREDMNAWAEWVETAGAD